MKARFDELLPFYVNGTLDDDERVFVEQWLSEHPAAQGELRWARSLRQRVLEDLPPVGSEVGLDKAMARIRAERPRAASAAPSLLQRARDWLAALVPQPVRGPALAAALAVVAVQGVWIGTLVSERDDAWSEERAVPKGNASVEPASYLKLNFKPDARETDIRMLLIDVQGSLAAGPGQLGDYYVRVPKARLDAALSQARASAIVDGVAVFDALPAKP